ncbi:iron ABC transporter permease [Nocardioides hwasunensis]
MLRAVLLVLSAASVAVGLVAAHLLVGRSELSAGEVVEVLTGRSDHGAARVIVLRYRLPRVLLGLGAGALLAMSGVLVQAVVRNPLAEPATTGVGSGAALGVVAATMLGFHATYAAALVGALGAGLLLLLLGRRSPAVAGILLGAVLAAVTALLLVVDSSPTSSVMRWLVGSLNARTAGDWSALWPWLATLPVAAWLLAPWMNAWALGAAQAISLGVPVRTTRVVVLVVAVVAAAVAIAAAGAVAFVGLVAPHVARLLVGSDHRLLVPVSAALGAVLLAGSDLIAFSVGIDLPGARDVAGVPVGAVTALLGAPVLVHLVRKELR